MRKEGPILAELAGLFAAALLAATLLPAQSEALLAGLIAAGSQPVWLLVAVASAGNILGAVINWGLGRGLTLYRDRRWFPVSQQGLARAEAWYRRYGRWSLLFSWVPVIGDPLTVIAGSLREPFAVFLLLVALGKIGRYLAIAAVTLQIV
ncbi:DedA family protein [Microvirga tunisiensis]|uniref:DedA family protein n=2 Tax=Pannonibacter tanglangensis TaxID=2750084 RepID=A0A7X5F2S7_9HYPH|nr:DedA family protein [Pannonibacter sp. XCT-34]NBN78716.1 DedA family protein [Pannonibacter sp. XCT-53]